MDYSLGNNLGRFWLFTCMHFFHILFYIMIS